MRETDHWQQVVTPPEVARIWDEQDLPEPDLYVHKGGGPFQALVTRDPLPGEDHLSPRWHISVAGKEDVPPWDVMANAGHELRPGVCFCLGVPPKSWWLNVHPHTLHLWELRDERLMDTWRGERRGDRPT